MTANDPDPRAFETWEDAFQYPISAVRKFEQQLRQHAEENRQKLRNLVGYVICCFTYRIDSITDATSYSVSYRDLLGTAERIIDMDRQIQQVEVTLGETGHSCNSRAMEKLFSNYSRYRNDVSARKRDEYSLASELAILQSCPTIMSRLLKHSHSSLLAAKIWVLSRLTSKALSQRQDGLPHIESLRNRLASLHRKLLQTIDRRLSDPDAEVPVLVEEMCAFSLVTSSTPTDVLRHFHHVRLETINRNLNARRARHKHVLNAMKLYIGTLRDSQVIFPRRLADALSKLRLQPLLQQKDVRATSELGLHLHEQWISDELRNYSPWLRHDELSSNEADKLLKAWAKQALSAFLTGTQAVLEQAHELTPSDSEFEGRTKLESIMDLRKATLEAWPWSGTRLPGLDPADVVDRLREVFNRQLHQEAHKSILLIKDFTIQLQTLTQSISPIMTSPTLWTPTLLTGDIASGAHSFKAAILSAYHGQPPSPSSTAISACTQRYEAFLAAVSSIRAAVKQMRETRWDDPTDTEDYDIDMDSKQQLLSHDDPLELENALQEALENAMTMLNSRIEGLVRGLPPLLEKEGNVVPWETIAILRVLRDVQQRNVAAGRPPIPSSIIQALHRRLAYAAIRPALKDFSGSAQRVAKTKSVVARALWEGGPPLPVQPSPQVFKMLRRLESDMSGFGADLWSAGAAIEVKEALDGRIGEAIEGFVESVKENRRGVNERAEGEEEDEDSKKEKLVQMLFDALYLQRAINMERKSGGDGRLANAVDELVEAADIGNAELNRLRRNATEYWKKSYLLFALLAG